jgi:hypothetical protein
VQLGAPVLGVTSFAVCLGVVLLLLAGFVLYLLAGLR